MEKYILKNPDSFNLIHIFECGQCFRWNRLDEEGTKFIGVIKNAVVKVEKNNNDYIFTGKKIGDESFEKMIRDYFDLDTSYAEYKDKLSKVDDYLKESIEFGEGIRILKQDLWETIISFIISANNNIPRIKKIIEKMSEEYGKKIIFEEKTYNLFPTVEDLKGVEVSELRMLGLGFRDIRVFNTTHMIYDKIINLDNIKEMKTTEEMRDELLKLDGVGPKVADCILLFALKRVDVFPIDVWVRRVMNDLYIHSDEEEKINKKELQNLAKEKFLGLSGIAQQYLFYWRREQ